MADLLATKNNQLIRVPSKESLLSISTTVSEKSGQSQNQLIENDPLDVSESTTVTTSLTFEKLEVKDSSAVNIEDKFNCLSVNESAPS